MASIASQIARAVAQGTNKEEALQNLGGATGEVMRKAQAAKANSEAVQTPFGTVNQASGRLASALDRRKAQNLGTIADTTERISSIESRLDMLENSGGGDVTQPSTTVNPATPPAAQAVAGSMMGNEFLRNAVLGAAKMIEGKKINQ